MKRLTALFLVLLLLLSCAACGRRDHDNTDNDPGGDTGPVQAGQPTGPEDGNVPGADDTDPGNGPEGGDGPEAPAGEETPGERVIDPSLPMVALTFDDGPDKTYTEQICNILTDHNALATFFLVGSNAASYPSVVGALAEAGMEIGSHSYSHSQMTKMSNYNLLLDMSRADAAIEKATGSLPYLVRPPYGDINTATASAVGRPMVCWNIDTEDWKSRDCDTIVDYVQNYGDLDGGVLLFHSIYGSTADAIAILVPWLQEQGYQLVTVTELMSYYYGEWPQPGAVYHSYFLYHGRTDAPLPLPGPDDLVAQPIVVPPAPPPPPPVQQPETPPEEPEDPVDPVDPTDPENPEDPVDPDDPADPSDPDDPAGTDPQPEDPETPPEDGGETGNPDPTPDPEPSEGDGDGGESEAPPEDDGEGYSYD